MHLESLFANEVMREDEKVYPRRETKGISLSKACCRTEIKGNRFEETPARGESLLYFLDLFSCPALGAQF